MGVASARTLRGAFLFFFLIGSLAAAPKLRLSTTTVGPISVAEGAADPDQQVEAFNAGDGALNLSFSASAPWLVPAVGPQRACTPPQGGVCLPIQIGLLTAALAQGTHTAVLTVRDPNAVDAPQTVTVTVQVGGGVPGQVELFAAPNGPSDKVVFHTNSNVAAQINTQDGRPWLMFSVDGGGTFRFVIPYRIEGRHLAGMAEGNYNGTVTIANSAFAPDNKAVNVVLHVTSQPIAQASAERVRFRILQDGAKSDQFLGVSNRGLGSLTVNSVTPNVPEGQNWLSVEAAGDMLYKVTADPAGLAPGRSQGSLAVASNAASPALTVPVELEIVAPGPPWAYFAGTVNNATFEANDPVPQGGICALFGEQLSYAGPQEGKEFPLVRELGAARVLVNSNPVSLYFSSYGQINFQMPYETPAGEALVRVERDGQPGNTVSVQVVERASKILRLGIGDYGIIVNQDESFPIPPALAAQLGVNGRPARVGDALVIYAIGLGPTIPAVPSGVAAPDAEPLARVEPRPVVVFGGDSPFNPSQPFYVGLTPFFVGLYQINVFVPEGTPAGDEISLRLAINGAASNVVRIAVQ